MKVSNLAQLKKAMKEGHKFKIVNHYIRPDWTGQIRCVQHLQTNGLYSGIDGEPDHELSQKNYGKGLWMPFGKASDWLFENGNAIAINKQDGTKVFEIEVL